VSPISYEPGAIPERGPDLANLQFVPSSVQSVSLYQLHDAVSFWSELNAAVSSHADLIGAIAARPMLKSILKSYGIDDPDAFFAGDRNARQNYPGRREFSFGSRLLSPSTRQP
jgi:hypothetical protein